MAWRRGQAYGQDLRERVLAAVDAGGSMRQVATRFEVSVSYVAKACARRRVLGQSTPGAQRNHVAPRLAGLQQQLSAQAAAQPDATIAELRAWAASTHGVTVSHAAMWTALARLGLRLKKSRCVRPSSTAPT